MRESGPVRKRFSDEAAAQYVGPARVFLGQMKQFMETFGIEQLWRMHELDDGTRIRVGSVFGQDTIEIEAPGVSGEPAPAPLIRYGLIGAPVVGTSTQNPVILVWMQTEKVWKRYFFANYTDAYSGAPLYSTYDWRSNKQKEQTSIERREHWWPSRYYGIDLGAANVYRDGEVWFTGGSFTHPFSGSPYTLAAWTITEDEETKWACLLVKTAHYSGTPNDFRFYKRVFSESYPNELEYDADTNPLGWQLVEQIDTPVLSPQYTSRKMADPQSFCAINASGTKGQIIAHDTPSKSDGTPHNTADLTYPLGRYVFTFSPDAMTIEYVENDGVDLIYRSSYFESENVVGVGGVSTTGTYPGPFVTTTNQTRTYTRTQRHTIGSVHGGGNPYPEILNAKIVIAVDYDEDTPLYLTGKVDYPDANIDAERIEVQYSNCVGEQTSFQICGGIPPVFDTTEYEYNKSVSTTITEGGTTDPEEALTKLFLVVHEGTKSSWAMGAQKGTPMLYYAVPKANDAAPAYGYLGVGAWGGTKSGYLEEHDIPAGCTGYPGKYNIPRSHPYTTSGYYANWTRYAKGNLVLADLRAKLLCIAARTNEDKELYTADGGDYIAPLRFQGMESEYDDKRNWVVYTDNGDTSGIIHEPTPTDNETDIGVAYKSDVPCGHSSSYSESTTPGDPTYGFLGIRDYLHGAAMFALDNRKYGTPKYWHYMDASVNCDPHGNVLASLRHYDEDDTEIKWSILFNNNGKEVTDLLEMVKGAGSLPDYLSLIGAIGFVDLNEYNETPPGGGW